MSLWVKEGLASTASESLQAWGLDDALLGYRQPQIPELSMFLLRGDTGIKSVLHT